MRRPKDDMHVELAEQLAKEPDLSAAAIEYCLAFKAWRDLSRESNKFEAEWSPATNQLLMDWQAKMDVAWAKFQSELNAQKRELSQAKTPPIRELSFSQPRRKR